MRHSNSEVDLPICKNMTHILLHYGKLPADRWSKGFFNFFLAVQDSSIGDIVTHSLTESVSE